MPPQTPPIVLSIAGFDPSSGAGVTADIKTFAAHSCFGVACVTALTVQSTAGVKRVEPVGATLVSDTLEELASDLPIAAVRIGMLGSAEVVEAVATFLSTRGIRNVVLDPILKASSGAELIDKKGVDVLIRKLIPLCTVITPNVEEAGRLTGMEVSNLQQMKQAARQLHDLGAPHVVVTGGHLEKAVDLLSSATPEGARWVELGSDRIKSTSTHGTGCAFAAALAANLAQGRQVGDAAIHAKVYVTQAIARAYPVGKGTGPLHHLYRMDQPSGRPEPDELAARKH